MEKEDVGGVIPFTRRGGLEKRKNDKGPATMIIK